jgi:trigger factor
MNITIADSGACQKTITIAVPVEEVDKKYRQGLKTVSQQVNIPGFRAGKVPSQLVEKKYGKYVSEQVREDLLKEAVEEARKGHGLDMISSPVAEELPEIQRGNPYQIELKVEVRPEFELPEYRGQEIAATRPTVTDKEVELYEKNVRLSFGEMNPIPAGEQVESSDLLYCRFRVIRDDKLITPSRDGTIEVSTEMVLGIPIPEAAAKFAEIKSLDPKDEPLKFSFEVTLPADFPLAAHAGASATVEVDVVEAVRPTYVEMSEEILSNFDVPNIEEFRDRVRQMMMAEKQRQIESDLADRLLEKVVSQVQFEIPPKYAENQLQSVLANEAYRMMQEGATDEQVGEYIEHRKQVLPTEIEAMMRELFVIDAIAKKERVFVTEPDVHRAVEQLAARQQMAPADLYQRLVDDGRIASIRSEIKRGKVRAELVRRARVAWSGDQPEAKPEAEAPAETAPAE